MLDPERARRLAQAALAHSGAAQTEVSIDLLEQELNRFTHEHPVQNQLRNTARVAVRVHVDGREGKATTGTFTAEAVKRTVDQAVAVAKHMPKPAADLLPMAGEQEYELRRPEPVRPDPASTAASVGAMTGTCRERRCRAAGTQGTENQLRLVANSNGLDVWDIDTRSQVSLSVFDGDGAGWASAMHADREKLDPHAIAERAVAKAQDSRQPRAVEPGHYTVILEPAAVASLLLFASYRGFGAQQVQDGSSFLAGHLGEQIFGDNVSIDDDVHHPLTVGHTFDGEGVPRQTIRLVEGGIARNVVYDRRTAFKQGCQSTGHAEPQPSPSGPLAKNLVLPAGDVSSADLLSGVDHGILVTQFHYTNMVEPTKLTLTGMTRNGTFLVERGEVARPVKNMRFTQSLVEALNRVTAIAGDATLCSALFGGNMVVPSLRIDGFGFSSTTEF
jgi:PmbA protein